MITITLGSTSTHKLEAVRKACQELGLEAVVLGIKTSSGQNEQPIGFDETFRGALARATAAKKQEPKTITIGIESGIFRSDAITIDMAVIVLLTNDGRKIITTSEGIQFPEEYVRIAEKRGLDTTTVGSVIAEQLGGDPTDPHATLTKGKVTRNMTLVNALSIALQQI